MTLRPWQKTAAQLVIGLSVFGVLVSYIDPARLRELAHQVAPGYLVAMFAVNGSDRVFMSWKWTLLLRAASIRMSQLRALKFYYQAGFLGFAVPFGIGPDVVRFLQMSAAGERRPAVMATIVMERILGLFATLLVVLLGLLLLFRLVPPFEFRTAATGIVLGALALLLLVFGALLSATRGERFLHALRVPKLATRLHMGEHYGAFISFREHRRTIVQFTLLSCLEQFFAVLAIYFAARALGIPLGFIACLAVVPVTLLAERLPLSILGFGFREGSYVWMLSLLGVDLTSAMLLSLTAFLMDVLVALPAGAWFLVDSAASRSRDRRAA